jgi:hypothetical protein
VALETYRQNDFTGGENRKLMPEFVQPNQIVVGQNCLITPEGVIETRRGKVKLNLVSLGVGPIKAIKRFAKEDGTKFIVVQHGTTLYFAEWDGYTQFNTFTATTKTTLTGVLRFVVWKNNLICYSPTDAAFRFDGTTITALAGSPPLFKHLVVYENRLWGTSATNPNQVRFCELENYDLWDALNIINVRSGDGDVLMGLMPVPGGMLLCKSRSVFPLTGTNRLNIRVGQPISGVGAASTDGILDGVLVGYNNWYLAGLNMLEPIQETHTPVLDTITNLNKQTIFATMQSKDQRAFYYLPNGEVIVLDGKQNAVTTWSGLSASCLAVAEAVGDGGSLLIGSSLEGQVYTLTGDDDDGAAITTFIKLPYQDYGKGIDKEWRCFWPKVDILSSGEFELFFKFDIDFKALRGQTTFTGNSPNVLNWGYDPWGGASWGSSITSIETPFWFHSARGEHASFEIKINGRIRFKGYETRYRMTGRKTDDQAR